MRALRSWPIVLVLVAGGCREKSAPSNGTPASTTASSASAKPSGAAAKPQPPKGDHVAIARAFVDHLTKKEFDEAEELFAPDVAQALPADKLEKAWSSSIEKGGEARAVTEAQLLKFGEREVVIVRATLEKGSIDSHVGFKSGHDEIVGFNIDKPVVYTAPSYVDFKKYAEREVFVGSGNAALPGTLTSPVGDGPFPAVVLVHGSGPGDRDESIGPSRPFRDLALGLASRGITVLRWEKRTRGFVAPLGIELEALTIKEEYLDDVAAAVTLLRATPTVDAKKIFILGHSMGGMLTPKLLAADPQLAGGIIFSGNARPLEDILVGQYTYLAKVDDGKIGPLEQIGIDDVAKQIKKVKDPALSEKTDARDLPLGLPAKYWLSVRNHDPVALAKTLPQPLLVLQGGRDYQVTEVDDFALWKKGLAAKKNATFQLYANTNHAGIPGEGMATPAEYEKVEGHVDPKIVDDVATFVLGPANETADAK